MGREAPGAFLCLSCRNMEGGWSRGPDSSVPSSCAPPGPPSAEGEAFLVCLPGASLPQEGRHLRQASHVLLSSFWDLQAREDKDRTSPLGWDLAEAAATATSAILFPGAGILRWASSSLLPGFTTEVFVPKSVSL